MNSFSGPLADPAGNAGHAEDHPPRKGFFTDTSICIGCKACEVACKTWNQVPEDGISLLGTSYDNTGALGASTWRHVAFIEQRKPLGHQEPGLPGLGDGVAASVTGLVAAGGTQTSPAPVAAGSGAAAPAVAGTGDVPDDVLGSLQPSGGAATLQPSGAAGTVDLGMPMHTLPGAGTGAESRTDFRWLMSSDVCKHCTHAACLDVCPTGALFRTEFGTVVVQSDICNGCGYCIPACPYGVIDQRKQESPTIGLAQKCTLCYDRLKEDLTPACAQACPTQSIQFGDVDELRQRAAARVETLHEAGISEARLYGHDPNDGVGGNGAFFLLLDEPEVYGFPPDPVVTTRDLPEMWRRAGLAALGLILGATAVFVGSKQ